MAHTEGCTKTLHNAGKVFKRAPVALLAVLFLVAASSAGAEQPAAVPEGASAHAFAVRVTVPGQPSAGTPTVNAPDDSVQFSGSFTYGTDPATGAAIVSTGSANASASALAGPSAQSSASAQVSTLSVFGGEVTATTVAAAAHAEHRAGAGKGNVDGTTVAGLVVLGQSVTGATTVALADWGSLTTMAGGVTGTAVAGYGGHVTALEIKLTLDHGGLPAGTTIDVGFAEVAAKASPLEPLPAKPKKVKAKAPEPLPGFPPIHAPPTVTPKLTAGGYVFPVYGPSSFVDTFGAVRGDISSGWHHGDDIFAPLGAPILAVAAGTVPVGVGTAHVGNGSAAARSPTANEAANLLSPPKFTRSSNGTLQTETPSWANLKTLPVLSVAAAATTELAAMSGDATSQSKPATALPNRIFAFCDPLPVRA